MNEREHPGVSCWEKSGEESGIDSYESQWGKVESGALCCTYNFKIIVYSLVLITPWIKELRAYNNLKEEFKLLYPRQSDILYHHTLEQRKWILVLLLPFTSNIIPDMPWHDAALCQTELLSKFHLGNYLVLVKALFSLPQGLDLTFWLRTGWHGCLSSRAAPLGLSMGQASSKMGRFPPESSSTSSRKVVFLAGVTQAQSLRLEFTPG